MLFTRRFFAESNQGGTETKVSNSGYSHQPYTATPPSHDAKALRCSFAMHLHVAVVLLLYGHDGLLERGGVVEGDDAHAHPRAVIALQRVGHVVLVAVFVHEDVMPDHPRLLRGALRLRASEKGA